MSAVSEPGGGEDAHIPEAPVNHHDRYSIPPTPPSLEESCLSAHTIMTALPMVNNDGDEGVLVPETPEYPLPIVPLPIDDSIDDEEVRRENRRRADPYHCSNAGFRRQPTPPFLSLYAELHATRTEARKSIENAVRNGEENSKYYLPLGHDLRGLTREQRDYRTYITNRLVGLFVESPVLHPTSADLEIDPGTYSILVDNDDFDPLEGIILSPCGYRKRIHPSQGQSTDAYKKKDKKEGGEE